MNLTPQEAAESLKITLAAYRAVPYTNRACRELLEKVQKKEQK